MIDRIRSAIAEFGFLPGCLYLLDQLLSRISLRCRFQYYDLMVQPITTKPLIPERFISKIHLREIERSDPLVAAMPATDDIKRNRFDSGAICLGAFREEEAVGYLWLSQPFYDEDEVRCRFDLYPPELSVFDYDVYIFPEARMGFAFAALWQLAAKHLHDNGARYTFSRVSHFNESSRRAHERLGARRIGSAWFLKLGVFEAMVATTFPYLHLSFSTRNRVRLKLDAC